MMFKLIKKKTVDAMRGIISTAKEELSFQVELVLGALLAIFIYAAWPLEITEVMALGICYALVLITEMVNTSLENALERLHPERHDLIGKSKDMAAGSVMLALGLLIVVFVLVVVY